MSCRCRPAGRLSALLGTGVRAQKPNLLALRAAEREPNRRPDRLSALLSHRGSRTKTEFIGFAGNRARTLPAAGRASGQNVGASQRRHKALPAMGRQLGRRPGRTSGQNVGASQRRHKALPAMGRQLGRCPADSQGKMLAPRNGGIRLCRQWGANSVGDRPSLRVKCWRPATEIQGFAGNGAPTWAMPGRFSG